MSNTVIKVEHVSKSYILKHQNEAKYTALRDVISNKAKSLFGSSNPEIHRKSSEEFLALNDISFDIQQGDRVGIIGRNGAGKSTLLKVLSRIVTPTKGRITIDGRVASLLEVGTGFHPELSGRENIFLNGSILGMSKSEIQKKFDEIVDFSEVERFLDTPVKRYSSGMYVRLAFAVAAHLEPEILVVDEVLAVGDADFQKKCLGKMKDVSGEGRTVLFVSHNMEAIQKLCSSAILLEKGKLIASGNIEMVVRKYVENNSKTGSLFNLPMPNELGIKNGYATSVQIEDSNSGLLGEISLGQDWCVRVKFLLNRNVEAFVAGIGIVTMMDLPVRTTWSKAENMKAGNYEAVFNFGDIMLSSGAYKLVIGLSSNQNTFHYVDNVVTINISDVSTLVNDPRIINTKSGLLLNQATVSIISK